MIQSLTQITTKDVGAYGGKAANLGELIKAGFNVPQGFVLQEINKDDKDRIYHCFGKLDTQEVSVRSSANFEDSTSSSFAGLFESKLNIKRVNLISSVKEVFNSKNSDKIIAYAELKNIDLKELKLSVIVQKMIKADFSGTCFTANPITGDKETVIEWVSGLGDKLVSGYVTPYSCIVKDNSIGHERIQTYEVTNDKILELAVVCRKIEDHFGYPMDIEWSIENTELFILQARPITTL